VTEAICTCAVSTVSNWTSYDGAVGDGAGGGGGGTSSGGGIVAVADLCVADWVQAGERPRTRFVARVSPRARARASASTEARFWDEPTRAETCSGRS